MTQHRHLPQERMMSDHACEVHTEAGECPHRPSLTAEELAAEFQEWSEWLVEEVSQAFRNRDRAFEMLLKGLRKGRVIR